MSVLPDAVPKPGTEPRLNSLPRLVTVGSKSPDASPGCMWPNHLRRLKPSPVPRLQKEPFQLQFPRKVASRWAQSTLSLSALVRAPVGVPVGGQQRDRGPASHHVRQYLGRTVAGLLLCGQQTHVSEVVTAESSQRLPGPGLGTQTARSNQGASSRLHPRPSSLGSPKGMAIPDNCQRHTQDTGGEQACGVPCRATPA